MDLDYRAMQMHTIFAPDDGSAAYLDDKADTDTH